jgi:hypothetical protein
LWPGRHIPAPHRQLLKRLEQKALEECVDASQRAYHTASIEKFLGIEDASAAPELQARQQFATDAGL